MSPQNPQTTRRLGGLLVGAGTLLLGVYLVPTVYGAVMSHLEVARFRARSTANREWDSARIRAYERTLSVQMAPPEAVLRVPRLGVDVPVLEGTSDLVLNRGVGHVEGTALPGERGNVAIAGHRDGFFRPLKDIAAGDVVELERPVLSAASGATTHRTERYVVRRVRVVDAADTSVFARATVPALTLVTCFPFHYIGPAPQRYVVQATPATAAEIASSSVPSNTGD